MRRAILGFVGAAVVVPLLAVAACSTEAALAPAGAECFQATDCEPGLVCAPQKNGPSVCTSDLSGLVATEDAGGDTGATGNDAASRADGSAGDAPVTQDAPPPPVDANKPVDANMPDNAAPPPPVDAGGGDAAVD